MRVLHIVGSSKYGGGYVVIFSLCKMAREHGIEPFILTSDPIAIKESEKRGISEVQFHGIDRPIRPWKDWWDAHRLTTFLKANQFDIVHTHTTKGGIIGRLAANKAGVPVIIHHAHAFPFHPFNRLIITRIYIIVERQAAKWCDLIVTTSNDEAREAVRFKVCKVDKIIVANNGIIDTNSSNIFDSQNLRTEFNCTPDDVVCTVVGRVEHLKGHGTVLNAVSKILYRNPSLPLKLWIVGDGDDLEFFKLKAKSMGIADNVIFTGFRNDVSNILHSSDIFCLPSLREGLSIALLEAMSVGLPCVVSDIRGMRDIFQDNTEAILFSSENYDALALSLERLITSEGLRLNMGKSARMLFERRFTEDIYIDKVWQCAYKPLLKAKELL